MSATASPTTSANTKRTIKRKLDESVLKKAREALGLPLDTQDDEPNDQPSLKWRKPRHNTEEGQKYVKSKEKRRKLEQEAEAKSSTSTTKGKKRQSSEVETESKTKKKRKKKKKGKKSTPVETKTSDNDKRHEMSAISYLQLWSTNRDHWKFEKLKQMWLLKNSLHFELINDGHFEILLEYIATMKGAARKATLDEMGSVVTKYELGGGGESNSANDGKQNDSKLTEIMYERARQIIQMLTDD